MSKVYFSHDEILERPNKRYDAPDPFQIHYHFRPARPANFCVTKDLETGEINVSAGTFGPLTWVPYTMCLHINIESSPHTYRNLQVGRECVISMPGNDIVKETWITALPMLRGISEFEVAGLHTCPSKFVSVPGVLECPVNFECVVDFKKDYFSHSIIFVRVLGASIDEKVLSMNREEVVHWFPTYEVDDVANEFGGSVERLGVMGDIYECPTFPSGTKKGWSNSFVNWMKDLKDEGYLEENELNKLLPLIVEYNGIFGSSGNKRLDELKVFFTKLPKFIVNEDWKGVHSLVNEFR